MIGDDALRSAALPALDLPGAEGVEVALRRSDTAVTRFAGSRVHQSSSRLDAEARVRVVADRGRVGVVATNDLSAHGVREAAERALAIARLLPPDEDFPGLAPPARYAEPPAPDDETAHCAPGRRAELVGAALAELPAGVHAAGTLSTGVVERALVTSTGIAAYAVRTGAGATVLATGPTSSGWAEAGGPAVGGLDLAALGRRAADKVQRGAAPRELPPGRYPVVLEAPAAAELVTWLGWLAFPAKAVAEGRSALTGRLGEQVCSPLVTVADDPLHPLLAGAPFDAEGTPVARLPLLEAGRAVGLAHDRTTARRAGTTSTGSALPPPNPEGGVPGHLVLQPGEDDLDALVAGLERGLYVTRLHYVNVVHPVTATLTGMTRDGTFLVEDGRVVGGVRNLRFTDSALGALGEVQAVGRDLQAGPDLLEGGAAAPSLRLGGFTFTSTTAY